MRHLAFVLALLVLAISPLVVAQAQQAGGEAYTLELKHPTDTSKNARVIFRFEDPVNKVEVEISLYRTDGQEIPMQGEALILPSDLNGPFVTEVTVDNGGTLTIPKYPVQLAGPNGFRTVMNIKEAKLKTSKGETSYDVNKLFDSNGTFVPKLLLDVLPGRNSILLVSKPKG